MIDLLEREKCTGCLACKEVCAKDAIKAEFGKDGFIYPIVEASACIDCGLCMQICPISVKKLPNKAISGYAAYTRNYEIRKESTSGGVFSEIAEYVLKQNGCIYGVSFDDKFGVEYICVESKEQLGKLRGSKYIQSNTSSVYKQIKEKLTEQRLVLFAGTPCQVAGLKSYLRKEYENLLSIDFVCFGIGSPEVWKKYLSNFWNVEQIQSIVFKEKKYGWDRWHFTIKKKNGKVYRERGKKNLYMSGYLDGIYIRPSCSNCHFKGDERLSDITIADCWGIEDIAIELNDNKGISAIVIRSNKGQSFFDSISEKIVYKEIEVEQLLAGNPYAYKSAKCSENREQFLDALRENEKAAFFKYCSKGKISYYIEKMFLSKVRMLVYIIRNIKIRWKQNAGKR